MLVKIVRSVQVTAVSGSHADTSRPNHAANGRSVVAAAVPGSKQRSSSPGDAGAPPPVQLPASAVAAGGGAKAAQALASRPGMRGWRRPPLAQACQGHWKTGAAARRRGSSRGTSLRPTAGSWVRISHSFPSQLHSVPRCGHAKDGLAWALDSLSDDVHRRRVTSCCFLHPAGKVVTAAAVILIGGISFSVARHAGA